MLNYIEKLSNFRIDCVKDEGPYMVLKIIIIYSSYLKANQMFFPASHHPKLPFVNLKILPGTFFFFFSLFKFILEHDSRPFLPCLQTSSTCFGFLGGGIFFFAFPFNFCVAKIRTTCAGACGYVAIYVRSSRPP